MGVGFVCVFVISIVFIGLISLILMIELTGFVCRNLEAKPSGKTAAPVQAAAGPGEKGIPDTVSVPIITALMTELGCGSGEIRIQSIRKI